MSQRVVIQGLAEAIENERLIRDSAFLAIDGEPIPERIAHFKVWPMTLRHFLTLRMAGNPLIVGGPVGIENVAQLIWVVSVDYRPSTHAQVKWFEHSGLLEPKMPHRVFRNYLTMSTWSKRMADCVLLQVNAVEDCRKYLAEALQDRPRVRGGSQQSFYSDACFWSARISREYTIPLERVPDMPLKQIFQYLNEIKDFNGKGDSLVNPSNDLIAQWQTDQQRKN